MNDKIGDKQRLLHIIDAIKEIENYTQNTSFESFMENSMMRFASIKQIEIIGEAANSLSDEIINKFADIEWRQIIGMRNVLIHEYFGVTNTLVWQVIVNDLPSLKANIESVIAEIE